MDTNLPVWKYYEHGFVDPLYAPYQKQSVYMPVGPYWYQYPNITEIEPYTAESCVLDPTERDNISPEKPHDIPITDRSIWNKNPDAMVRRADINYRKTSGCCDNVYPELMKVGWGTAFQLKHPIIDPCPQGYTKSADGWCYRERDEYEPIFYSDKGPVFKNENFYGYAQKHNCKTPQQYERGNINYKGGYSWSSKWANPQERNPSGDHYSGCARGNANYASLPVKFSYV